MYEMDQYTVSLLHFDSGLTDESGKVWTANGGAAISTTESKFGGSSLYCSARGTQWIETPAHPDFNVGSGDFTIECWVKIPNSENYQNMLGQGTYNSLSDYHYGVILCISSTGKLRTQAGAAPNSLLFDITSTTTITDNAWHHVAVIRSGNKVYLSVDGILEASTNVTGSVYSDTSSFRIIKSNNADGGAIGYYDEFRFSKGIARWTSDFDPNPKVGKALLIVTMSDEIQKEYDLSMDEINAFITWYNTRATGTGLPHYTFNKDFNLGPFQSRKDYLVFDKIQNFEVMEYTK
jgi:hypothetical protein